MEETRTKIKRKQPVCAAMLGKRKQPVFSYGELVDMYECRNKS